MSDNTPKFRFKFNLFDTIVLILAIIVVGVLLWSHFGGASFAKKGMDVRYTIRINAAVKGTGALMAAGDELNDNIKNYKLGTVVSSRSEPSLRRLLDEINRKYVMSEMPGYEDIYIDVISGGSYSKDSYGKEKILLSDGYELRVGDAIYVRGPGYLGSGVVYAIERGDAA